MKLKLLAVPFFAVIMLTSSIVAFTSNSPAEMSDEEIRDENIRRINAFTTCQELKDQYEFLIQFQEGIDYSALYLQLIEERAFIMEDNGEKCEVK